MWCRWQEHSSQPTRNAYFGEPTGLTLALPHLPAASERTLRRSCRSTTGAYSTNLRFGHRTRSFAKRYLWIIRPGCMTFEAREKGKQLTIGAKLISTSEVATRIRKPRHSERPQPTGCQ